MNADLAQIKLNKQSVTDLSAPSIKQLRKTVTTTTEIIAVGSPNNNSSTNLISGSNTLAVNAQNTFKPC